MTSAAALALGVAAVLLAVLAVTTARRPVHDVPGLDGYLDRWQRLHGGFDPRAASFWVRGWLHLVHAIGRPLARRGVQPDVVTLWSLWFALAVLVPASSGGLWPAAGCALLVVSGLVDNLDGCVAVLQRRTTRWGYVLDSVVDRLSDLAYLLALVVLGAPAGLAVAVGVGVFTLEYTRARAGNVGGDGVGTVTVAERPTRVIVVAAALLAAALLPGLAAEAATVGGAVLAVFTAVGLVQLVVAVRRQLLALPGRDEAAPTGAERAG